MLSGEAGIGKSRLTATLLERLTGEPHIRLRYFCSPQHTDGAFYPIIGQMERAAGFTHDDTPRDKLDKLDALLAQTSTSAHDAALFAEMLSLPNDGRLRATLDLEPQQRRHRTLAALVSQVEALAHQKPVLMIFEDAHWADPTTLEVFGRTIDRIRTLRVLLIVTFRPDFSPPWIGVPHVTALTINRLTQRDVTAMIDRVVGNQPLPAGIKQDIIERTDGIPLFVEEMTNAVLEMESQGAAEQFAALAPSAALAVPASLHASLMARLDRVGPAKEVAQVGAAIGREFSHGLLAAVIEKAAPEIVSALNRLIEAGLLFRQGIPPHASYLFKHALVQDAAYGTLLREPRRALHARIADALARQFPEIAESQPELLARHFTEAGAIEKAAGYWGKAGQRSLARSALQEAAEQLTRALAQIAALPNKPTLRRQEIKLQVALRHALMHLKGYEATETIATIERARQLVEQAEARGESAEDPLLLFSLLNGLWSAKILAFDGDAAYKLAVQFLARAERKDGAGPVVDGHRLLGTTLLWMGDIAEGREHLDRGIKLCDTLDDRPPVTSLGEDVRLVTLSFQSLALALLGYYDAALVDAATAVSGARELGQFGTLIHTVAWSGDVRVIRGEYTAARTAVEEMVELAGEKEARWWKLAGMLRQGVLMALTGQASEAVHVLTSNIAASETATFFLPWFMSNLAAAHAQLGQFEEARRTIGEAIAMIARTKERWCEAEINRMAGEIELKSPELAAAKAEAYFGRALAIARKQQAKSWELRAAMSMARLWRDQGRRNEARELLAPVYGWFTEGFDTLDLKEAKVLLDELSCQDLRN